MGVVKTIILVVSAISFAVFVALFGRLPIFRKTPISFLHRLLWVHIPRGFSWLDQRLTVGAISRTAGSTTQYLLHEAHPVVLIFFILLQVIAEALFIPSAWPLVSGGHRIAMLVLSAIPELCLYLCVMTTSNVTPSNHAAAMRTYPYDHTLYQPGHICRTCRLPKPARSKHCSICRACVQKQDHHCIWINNCVGRNNYAAFLALLLSTSLLLAYGTYLGHELLDAVLQARFVPAALVRGSTTSKRWATRLSWSAYADAWLWAVGVEWRVGAVALLAAMTFPLAAGFAAYNVYLVWAGMTTNESNKWADWRDDVADGLVFRADIHTLRDEHPPLAEALEPSGVSWPVSGKWWVMSTATGEWPRRTNRKASAKGSSHDGGGGSDTTERARAAGYDAGEADMRWEKVHSLAEIENIYDLSFWGNLEEVIYNRG